MKFDRSKKSKEESCQFPLFKLIIKNLNKNIKLYKSLSQLNKSNYAFEYTGRHFYFRKYLLLKECNLFHLF